MTPESSSAEPVTPAPLREATRPVWEHRAVWVILGVFAAVGIHNLKHGAFVGQDFGFQSARTYLVWQHPDKWFAADLTTRPMLYWIGSVCHWLTQGQFTWELASLIFVVLNVLALWSLHASTRRFISSPWLRVAAVAFVAFLPTTLIATVVYASDALGPLPFTLVAWCLLRSVEAPTTPEAARHAGLAGLALAAGNFVRLTFVGMPAAVIFVLVLSWRWGRITGRRALIIGGLAAVCPAIVGGLIHLKARQTAPNTYAVATFHRQGAVGEMTWSSLLLIKRADTRIFDAPGYWDEAVIDQRQVFPLLISNSYSYPALLHLSTFTDVLGIAYHAAPGLRRPEPKQALSRLSVWLGLPFSAAIILAVVAFSTRTAGSLLQPKWAPSLGVLVWGTLGLAWYLPLVLTLPFVDKSYYWGYWLPRLVIPALWGFSLVFFAATDELLGQRRRLAIALTAFVLIEAGIHAASVWI